MILGIPLHPSYVLIQGTDSGSNGSMTDAEEGEIRLKPLEWVKIIEKPGDDGDHKKMCKSPWSFQFSFFFLHPPAPAPPHPHPRGGGLSKDLNESQSHSIFFPNII